MKKAFYLFEYHVVFFLVFWINLVFCGSTTNVLLRVDAGTGVSFIDLWNMKGLSTGTDSDPIYRNGAIDNVIKDMCPSRLYFKFEDPNYQIEYRGTYTNLSLESWLTTTPYNIPDGVDESSVTLSLTPDADIQFQMVATVNPKDLFLVVYIPNKAAPYPEYYSVTSEDPVSGPITDPNVQQHFDKNTRLTIKARYEDGENCDLTDHHPNIPYSPQGSIPTTILQTTTVITTAVTTTSALDTTTSASDTTTTTPDTTTSASDTTTTTPDTTTSASDTTTTTPDTTTSASDTTTTTPDTTTSASDTTTSTPDTTTSASNITTTLPVTTTSTPDVTTLSVQNDAESTTNATAMCPCDCDFKNRLDVLSIESSIPVAELKVILAPVIREIKKNLSVDVSKLSSTIRKKQSASDKRPSATQIGVLGIILLSLILGLLVLIDITSIFRHLELLKKCFAKTG